MSDSKDLRGLCKRFDRRAKADGKTLGHFLSFENGEVDHLQLLSSQFGNLLRTQEQSDVTFIVEGREFEAHRLILSSRCEYFRALLYGGMKEATNCEKIELHDTLARPFNYLLNYIYTGIISLRNMEEKDIIDLLVMANKYSLLALESAITGFLRDIIGTENVTDIYDVASLFSITDLEAACLTYMDHHASDIITNDGFSRLSKHAALALISRKSFCATEIQIFRGVTNWLKENETEDVGELTRSVRLPLIDINDLLHDVRDSGLFSSDEILDAIQARTERSVNEMPLRGYLGR